MRKKKKKKSSICHFKNILHQLNNNNNNKIMPHSPSMSPFFRPPPSKDGLFMCFKNTIYAILASFAMSLVVSIPWFIDFIHQVLIEESKGQYSVSKAIVYSTCVVFFVIIISAIVFASYIVSIESFRFCMSFGTICLFAPLILVHLWRYVYAVAIMIAEILTGILFCIYGVLIIKYQVNEQQFGQTV